MFRIFLDNFLLFDKACTQPKLYLSHISCFSILTMQHFSDENSIRFIDSVLICFFIWFLLFSIKNLHLFFFFFFLFFKRKCHHLTFYLLIICSGNLFQELTEDKIEKYKNVRYLLQSSRMKLDDAIMLFHDF